ncbi:MAG TPA: hypothetical protein VNX68_19820, partial [Nitrosopumilaceae archaeon]|nr:hypothetical protein [Nitrosopumilaceae archaeon]
MDISTNYIFNINGKEEFDRLALSIFQFQAEHNIVYSSYLKALNISPDKIFEIKDIPFLPVEFFKYHKIITSESKERKPEVVFLSSGTSGIQQSRHYVLDKSFYEKSFIKGFEQFYGNIKEY